MEKGEELAQLRGEVDALKIVMASILTRLVNRDDLLPVLEMLETESRKANAASGTIDVFRFLRQNIDAAGR